MERTRIYLMRKFSEYYANAKLEMPREFRKREFAFVPFETLPAFVMHRHIAFENEEQFKTYILSSTPAHVYYSSAYYQHPNADRMEDKGWMKADLIFDIDADHLPVKTRSIELALKVAKKEINCLVRILQRDFGIERNNMKVVFSGGRGYHLHVYSDDFTFLGSAERREIVDYLLINRPLDVKSTQWLRICRCVVKYLLMEIKKDNLQKYRLTEKQREGLMRILDKETIKWVANGNLNIFRGMGKRVESMVDTFVEKCKIKLAVHIDAPVTADTKRLIRLPGSLHGKTGLKVTTVDELEDFDPLTDAIVFGDEKVKIRTLSKIRIRMAGEEVRIPAGEKAVVPEYLAVFLLCRGMAMYGH